MNWRRLFGHVPRDREIDDELSAHVALATADRVASGEARDAARRRALVDLGGVDQIREQVRDVRSTAWIERLGRELGDAVRAIRRTPGTALTSAALIALVVGGNITIFSVVYAILTKPARGVHADRLIVLESRAPGGLSGPEHSYQDYLYFAAASRTVRPLMAEQFERFTIALPGGSYAGQGALVSADYFEALGVRMARGRALAAADENSGASGLTAVVSSRLTRDHFDEPDRALGASILLNGHPATIVGVVAPEFQGAWLAESDDVWVPLAAYARVAGIEPQLEDRAATQTAILGRLASGATLADAQAEFTTFAAQLQAAYPTTNRQRTVGVLPYSVTAGGNSLVAQQGWRFLAIFTVVTALTIVIVCANVANLMLARAMVRQREVAVRQSLGASRGTIVRSLALEGTLIALVAWVASCLCAAWVARSIGTILPPSQQRPILPLDFTPDGRVLAYALILSIAGGIAFSLPPAIRTCRLNLLPWLKAGEQGIVQGRSRAASVLVVLQLTFAVTLLTSAGLAYRSLWLVGNRDLGFDHGRVLLATVNTGGAVSSGEQHVELLNRIAERLRQRPAVRAVSYAQATPASYWLDVSVTPFESPGAAPITAETSAVGPDFLRTVGLVPTSGRDLADERTASPVVAVVNQNLADALWPGESPVGRSIRLGMRDIGRGGRVDMQTAEVVGVSPNALLNSRLQRDTRPSFVLLAERQRPTRPGPATFYIRHDGAQSGVARDIGAALRDVDPRVAIVSIRSMDDDLESVIWPVRFLTRLLVLFAVVSVTIAALGQYAVIAFDVRRRTRDFGVRMALGASGRQIVREVLRQGFGWTAVGLATGFVLSVGIGRAGRALLFGVTSTDPLTYGGVFLMLAVISLAACYFPARRAARIDPMQVLRQE